VWVYSQVYSRPFEETVGIPSPPFFPVSLFDESELPSFQSVFTLYGRFGELQAQAKPLLLPVSS